MDRRPGRDITWDEANAWVHSLDADGGGWRLPTIAELKGLFQRNTGARNMPPLLRSNDWSVWSGEAKGAASRWAFRFQFGSVTCYSRGYSYEGRAFAVRVLGSGDDVVPGQGPCCLRHNSILCDHLT